MSRIGEFTTSPGGAGYKLCAVRRRSAARLDQGLKAMGFYFNHKYTLKRESSSTPRVDVRKAERHGVRAAWPMGLSAYVGCVRTPSLARLRLYRL